MTEKALVYVEWDDVPHLDSETKDSLLRSIQPHLRDARTRGIPVLGSGVIYDVTEDDIAVEPFEIPTWWPRIGGLDFGWDHPFAAVDLAHNPETDKLYVVDCYKVSGETALIHCEALKGWVRRPFAWPSDGLQHEKGSGKQLAQYYRDHGLWLLETHAQWATGGNEVYPGIVALKERMQTGRLKVFKHLVEWFAECRLYHRKNGVIAKEFDDLMDATRYAYMMLNFSQVPANERNRPTNEVFVY